MGPTGQLSSSTRPTALSRNASIRLTENANTPKKAWIHRPPPPNPPPSHPQRYLPSMHGWPEVPTNCSYPFRIHRVMSKSARCVPDGDSHAGQWVTTWRPMPVGWYGCYPGENKVYVEHQCSGLFQCENGEFVACGTSRTIERTVCACPTGARV